MLTSYYRLAKPGIVYGNLITTIAGLFFAARFHANPVLFLATIGGTGLVIASACVVNNYLDRDIDARMARTKERPFVTGTITSGKGLIYAAVLGIVGIGLLLYFVNAETAALGALGFVSYVFVYGTAKRHTPFGALIGTIPGALPLVMGYTAVTNMLDASAVILFMSMVIWQMPHFYGIALYRLEEYQEAGIPVLPLKKGASITKQSILYYIVLFGIVASLLTVIDATGYAYLITMALAALWWLLRACRGFTTEPDAVWAKRVFLSSLVVLIVFCVALAVGPLLP